LASELDHFARILKEIISREVGGMLFGLKGAIIRRGLSQRETSRLSSVPENRLSSIIRGWTTATPEERSKLAAVLRQPEDILFDAGSSIEIRSYSR
jgi:hypothetical protein